MTDLIQPSPIERDDDGHYYHPDLPHWPDGDNDEAIHQWMKEQGIVGFVMLDMFDGLTDLPDDEIERLSQHWEQTGDISEFPLLKPEGDDWFLLSIHETEDGPFAWWVTRSTDGIPDVGHRAPPRPIISMTMMSGAANAVVQALFPSAPEQYACRVQAILDVYVGDMSGQELGQALAQSHGWHISEEMIDVLGRMEHELNRRLRQAERAWVSDQGIVPELTVGQRVSILPAGETGTVQEVNHDGAGYYLILLDGDQALHCLAPYESTSALEGE